MFHVLFVSLIEKHSLYLHQWGKKKAFMIIYDSFHLKKCNKV